MSKIRIERLDGEGVAKNQYRFIRVSEDSKGKSRLEVLGRKFPTNGLVPSEVIDDLTVDELKFIATRLPEIVEKVSENGAY